MIPAIIEAGLAVLIEFLNLKDNAAYAVAGVLGISGRNLIVWLLMISKDPLRAWRDVGKKD